MSDSNLQNDIEYEWRIFPNIGYIKTVFTDEQLQPIRNEIDKIKSDFNLYESQKHNKQLAGNLEKEFKLKDTHEYIEKLLLPYAYAYENEFSYFKTFSHNQENSDLVLATTWVNFQKKNEFNPRHNHSGVLSFVIWIDIPYDFEYENETGYGRNSNSPSAGMFEFFFTNTLGQIVQQKISVGMDKRNTLLMFPASMQHQVYPFHSSDDYRISVSGNFVFKNDL